MDTELLHSLLSLGLLQPQRPESRSWAAVSDVGPEHAAEVLTRHKVRQITRARIGDETATAVARDLDSALARYSAARQRRGAALERQLDELRSLAPNSPVRLMKGLGVRHWYPARLPRDVGDADLWLPDMDNGWALAGALRGIGYDYEPGEMPWLKRDPSGVLFGQIRMVHAAGDKMDVDLHIGRYSVRYCGLIAFAKPAGGAWAPLADEDQLCAVLGNAAGDCFIDAKVVNDLVASTAHDLDLGYVAESLAAAELSGFLAAVVDQAFAVCELTPEQEARLKRLRGNAAAEPLTLAPTLDSAERAAIVASHARRMGLRLTGEETQAGEIAAQAHSAYAHPRSFRLRTAGGLPLRMPEPNPWTCVRLAPQSLVRRICSGPEPVPTPVVGTTPLAKDLDLVDCPEGNLVRFRREVFLPTVDYLFCLRLVKAEIDTVSAAR